RPRWSTRLLRLLGPRRPRHARAGRPARLAPPAGRRLPAAHRMTGSRCMPTSAGGRRDSVADFDTLLKDGIVVAGTRSQRYRADVGIHSGRIAKIGRLRASDADRALDASGMIVAPGFIDLHTHYDAQLFWDPYLTLSGWHGVTSVVIGNC